MLSATVKIILVVVCPTVFTALLIGLGLIHRRRTNRASTALNTSHHQDEAHQEIPAQTNDFGLQAGLGPSVALPAYEEKTISVRRLSAYPEMDEIRRVSSVTTTLGTIAAEGGERARRGSVASMASGTTLVVTDMGDGHVGVERRPSIPEIPPIPGTMRSESVSSSTSNRPKDPGSPRDRRFSKHLSHIISPDTQAPIDRDQPMEMLKTPLPISPSDLPRPSLRSPVKAKFVRRDSIELGILRSPTLAVHPPLPPPTLVHVSTEESPVEKNVLFKEWKGFDPPEAAMTTRAVSLAEEGVAKASAIGNVSEEGRHISSIDSLKESVPIATISNSEAQAVKTVSPAGISLPVSPH